MVSHPRAVALRHTDPGSCCPPWHWGVQPTVWCNPLQGHQHPSHILVAFPCPQCVPLFDVCRGSFKWCCRSKYHFSQTSALLSKQVMCGRVASSQAKCSLLLMKGHIWFFSAKTLLVSPMKNIRSRLQKCGIFCMMYFYLVTYF